ncbi:MAG: glutathione S-transferase family protein [Propionivibrio sp.]
MKLYFAPGTCALAPHIALNWVGAVYQAEQVELNSDAYKKINPSGTVPAFDAGSGSIKTQAGAILTYIADRYPQAALGADADAESRFQLAEQMAFLTGDFHPAFWPFFSPQRYTTSENESDLEKIRTASHALVDRVMTKLDRQLGEHNGHVALGRRTIADPYAFAMSRWADYLPKKLSAYPAIRKFHDDMKEDPGVQAALAAHGITN